jgi:formate hydrogenlyase subunit 3/multisubunit Na+/H+ antiporter MnhD subunit
MFLYPFWIIIFGVLFAYLSVKLMKNNTLAFCMSFSSMLSSLLVFLLYLTFTEPLSIRYFHHFGVFELNALNIFFCVLAVGVAVFQLLFAYSSFIDENNNQNVPFIIPCMLFLSIGSILSTGLYSFVLFFELTFLSFLSLAKSNVGSNDFSLFDYSVYFAPTALFIAGVLVFYFGNRDIYEIKSCHMTISMRILFIIAFSVRLFSFPFSFSVQRMVEMSKKPEFIYGLMISLVTVCSALIKFFRVDPEVTYVMMIISVIYMIVWSVHAFRQKEVKDMVALSYAVQTAFVVAALAMMFFETQLRTYFYWIFLNHIVSGLGMLIYGSLTTKERGKLVHILYMVFLFSFIGFFPSIGLLGRWIFFQSHAFVMDWFALFGLFALLVNLSSISYHLKWMPALWKRIHTNNDYRTSLRVKCLYGCLLLSLFGPLCLVKKFNRFFLLISSYLS